MIARIAAAPAFWPGVEGRHRQSGITEMSKIVFALAPMVLGGFMLFQSKSVFAQDTL